MALFSGFSPKGERGRRPLDQPPAIAIDGPVASGKTTVGRRLAARLGFRFLDTGLMYRAITWAAVASGLDMKDPVALTQLTRQKRLKLEFPEGGEARVWVDGLDVTRQLAAPQVEEGVSLVAQVPEVREELVAQQRQVARQGPIVMAGRDIGTVVLPTAPLKVFLTASLPVRARRRLAELQSAGHQANYGRVVQDLERRDRLDSTRAASPLRAAQDAHVISTDGRTIEEVVELVLALWGRR